VLEAEACGINRAFDRVRSAIRASDPEAVIIVLPGDLPLIDAAEVETALGRLAADGAVLVPASADGGTGALIFHASAPFQFRFGTDSFRRHYEAALKAGLEPLIAPLPSLGLDIDRPEDFDRVLDRGQAGRTARFLLDLHCCTEG
jgi:2-phospho-L-lactate guanylyltransferase